MTKQPGERAQDVTTVSSAEHSRRDFLYIATGAVGAVGAGAALVPLIAQMNPDASTIAAGAPVEIDLAPIADGQIVKVFWRSKPIFISHRTKKDIEEAQKVDVANLPDPEPDSERVKQGHDQWLVVIGICTHLGCIPLAHQGEYDGWFCPCHGSQYDTSGRIRKGPAPKNLPVPPYAFLSDTRSGSADPRQLVSQGFDHERTLDIPTAEQGSAMVREAVADRRPDSFLVRRLSD